MHVKTVAAAAAFLALWIAPAAAQEVTLRAVTSFAEGTQFSKNFERFIEKVNADGAGVVKINYIGGPRAMPPFEVGTGRVDVAAAVRNTVRGTGSLFFGNYLWPHDASDAAVTHDLTYTNTGDEDVTLDLAVTDTSGAFALGASSVTVPAGAKATVPVSGDPQAVDVGRHVGYVVGTDASTGEPVTRTSVALLKEDERYELRPFGTVPLGPFDNLEGVAAERRADGRTRLWLVTDNDFSERRRTLLIAVDVPATKK